MRPTRITVLASLAWACAAVACGIDAVGSMPLDATLPSSTPEAGSPAKSDDASTSTTDGDAEDASSGVIPEDAAVDAIVDDDAATNDAGVDATVGPLLELTGAAAPATVNLTNEGTLDWAYWGANGVSSPVRKVAPNVISKLTVVYNSQGSTANGFGTTFSWTNATNGSGSSDGYLFVSSDNGVSESFKVPSGPVKRTVVVWVGGNQIRGKLSAHLVDGTAILDKSDSQQSQSATFAYQYTIAFQSKTVSELSVKWEIDQGFGVNSARFTAVALR